MVHSLWVRKKADREMYMRGETVNYTITYGNDLAIDASEARLTDILPDVEFLDANPKPNFNNGSVLVWNLGTLPPNSSGTIQLYARINKSRTRYHLPGSAVGFRRGLHAEAPGPLHRPPAQEPDQLCPHRPPSTSTFPTRITSSATIGLLDALGTEVKLRGHGSGSYAREEETRLKTNNSTISLSTSLSARYRPSSFSLPGGREIGYTSKWHDATQSKNRITDSSTTESYSHASRLDRSSTLLLDKNGSTLESETSFEGAGSIGLLKGTKTNHTTSFSARDPAYESREDYLGSFTVYTKYDEYGKSVTASRSASGTGFASSDKRVSDRQRSYEYGTGSYSVEDEVQTQTNYMAKEINASHAPTSFSYTPRFQVNLSSKWNEGMWSRSGSPPAKGSNQQPACQLHRRGVRPARLPPEEQRGQRPQPDENRGRFPGPGPLHRPIPKPIQKQQRPARSLRRVPGPLQHLPKCRDRWRGILRPAPPQHKQERQPGAGGRDIHRLCHHCYQRRQPGPGAGLCPGPLPAGDGVYQLLPAAIGDHRRLLPVDPAESGHRPEQHHRAEAQ